MLAYKSKMSRDRLDSDMAKHRASKSRLGLILPRSWVLLCSLFVSFLSDSVHCYLHRAGIVFLGEAASPFLQQSHWHHNLKKKKKILLLFHRPHPRSLNILIP